MEIVTLQCAIEQIADWYPRLFLEPYIVACVAVMNPYSASPAVFEVECLNIASEWLSQAMQFRLEVSWLDETARKAEHLRLTMQKATHDFVLAQAKPLVEMAATALALILTHQVVNLGQLDVMNYGDRADYRSLDVPSVLEISGTEVPSELTRRHWEKVAQALANPLGLDAYVVVCAFSADGHRIQFSYHRWRESTNE